MVYQSFFGAVAPKRERTLEWPVGQVVKTEASHAFNIGSNPVRVTKCFLTGAPEGAKI